VIGGSGLGVVPLALAVRAGPDAVVDETITAIVVYIATRVHSQHVLFIAGARRVAFCPCANVEVPLQVPSAAAEDLAAAGGQRILSVCD